MIEHIILGISLIVNLGFIAEHIFLTYYWRD